MMRAILLIAFVILLVCTPVKAQTATPVNCDPASVIKAASALKSTGDNAKDVKALLDLSQRIEAANIACNGFTFKGNGNKVIGPFVLPKGTYKVSVTTKESFVLNAQAMTGSDCEAGGTSQLFNELKFDAPNDIEAETVLPIAADCRIILTTANSHNPWVFTFEPIE